MPTWPEFDHVEDYFRDYYGPRTKYADYFLKTEHDYDLGETQFLEPEYALEVQMWVARHSDLYKLLPKSSYALKGDAYHAISSDAGTSTEQFDGIAETDTLFSAVDTMNTTKVNNTDGIDPKVMLCFWQSTLHFFLKQGYTKHHPRYDEAKLKEYHANLMTHMLDFYTSQCVETPAGDFMYSIDTAISNSAESSTTYVSATTDNDIYGYTRASGAYDANVDLPSTCANRVLSYEELDDLAVSCIEQASSFKDQYFYYTSNKTLNEIQNIHEPKERFAQDDLNMEYTLGGVKTRKGGDVGFSAASLTLSGLKAPIFAGAGVHVATPVTTDDDGIGNFYMIDGRNMEIRNCLPTTFIKTELRDILTLAAPKFRAAFIIAEETFVERFNTHGKYSYVKASR